MNTSWVAGLYEGEGCIRYKPNGKGRGIEIVIVSTDLDVLEKAKAITGWNLYGPYARGTYKPQWRLSTGRLDNVLDFLSVVWPHLGIRRQSQALTALENYAAG